MASRDIRDLTPEMQDKALLVIDYCEKQGQKVLIYCTKRDLREQARLYRSSHDWATIKAKKEKFKKRGLGFLADILDEVGPQPTEKWKTNAAPGESYHGYLEAFDIVPKDNEGNLLWDYEKNKNAWNIIGDACKLFELEWGGTWPVKYKDYPHIQKRPGGNPLKMYSPEQVKDMLTKNGVL